MTNAYLKKHATVTPAFIFLHLQKKYLQKKKPKMLFQVVFML